MQYRKIKYLLFLIILFFQVTGIKLFACDCGPPENLDSIRAQEYKNSDVVFTGKIVFLSEGWTEFKIQVTETFKGDIKRGQVIAGMNNITCVPYINGGGQWLIYGKMENGMLSINQCGLSRSFKNPDENRYFSIIPVPPLPVVRDSSSDAGRIKTMVDMGKQYQERAVAELKKEIEMLRNKKTQLNKINKLNVH